MDRKDHSVVMADCTASARLYWACLAMACLAMIGLVFAVPNSAQAAGIPVKVVILTTFETGKDTGDEPGEFQPFAERLPLRQIFNVPGIEHPVLYSKDGVLGVVTGTRGRARNSLSALILDKRFDFSKAYWIVAGIAGVDPRSGSIGSAAWARYVVDGDRAFEMDDREIPAAWRYGLYWSRTDDPNPTPPVEVVQARGMAWKLDAGLVSWAYNLTKDVGLVDNDSLRRARSGYPSEPLGRQPPRVMLGESLGVIRFWHGERKNEWARDWVKLWTNGDGNFVMSNCEDQGFLETLSIFHSQGRVDSKRVLVMRTASNYTREPDGANPVMRDLFPEGGSAAAVEAEYRTVAPVVDALLKGWGRYSTSLPKPVD